MKKITRMIIFSATSLFILAQINSGVILPTTIEKIFISVISIAVIYYLINPILKILLLPINILTLGIASFIAYVIIFITINDYFNLIEFTIWEFPGISYHFLIIKKFILSETMNKVFSAFFISFIISLLEIFI